MQCHQLLAKLCGKPSWHGHLVAQLTAITSCLERVLSKVRARAALCSLITFFHSDPCAIRVFVLVPRQMDRRGRGGAKADNATEVVRSAVRAIDALSGVRDAQTVKRCVALDSVCAGTRQISSHTAMCLTEPAGSLICCTEWRTATHWRPCFMLFVLKGALPALQALRVLPQQVRVRALEQALVGEKQKEQICFFPFFPVPRNLRHTRQCQASCVVVCCARAAPYSCWSQCLHPHDFLLSLPWLHSQSAFLVVWRGSQDGRAPAAQPSPRSLARTTGRTPLTPRMLGFRLDSSLVRVQTPSFR